MDTLIEFDTWLLLILNGFNHEVVDPIMKAFSSKGIWVVMYVSIAAVIWWKYGWKRAILIVAAAGIAVGASDWLCASVIRPWVQRLRPSNLENEISALVHIVNGYRSGSYGFPSCHAANTFALAVFTSLILRYRWYTAWILAWALLQCYSRIYLGVHYPGDILVGASVGSALAYLMYCLCRRFIALNDDINPKANATPTLIVGAACCIFVIVKGLI